MEWNEGFNEAYARSENAVYRIELSDYHLDYNYKIPTQGASLRVSVPAGLTFEDKQWEIYTDIAPGLRSGELAEAIAEAIDDFLWDTEPVVRTDYTATIRYNSRPDINSVQPLQTTKYGSLSQAHNVSKKVGEGRWTVFCTSAYGGKKYKDKFHAF